MAGPMAGVSILDLSQVVAGPLATQILAEQGADVIKVEPIGGELTRTTGPDHIRGLYANCNRGKRCIGVDVTTAAGVDLVLELAGRADVVVQNFRPGVVERLGIDYDAVRSHNADVIYASVSGFGTTGPYRQRAVLDPVIQGLTGMVHSQVSEALPFPDLMRTLVADKATAHTVAQAITAALFARSQGAGGQHIQLAMLDAALSWFWPDGMADLTHTSGLRVHRPQDLYQLIDTADGQVVYYMATASQLEGMWRVIGRDDLLADENFCKPGRLTAEPERAEIAMTAIRVGLAAMTTADVVERMAEHSVPCGPVLTREQVLSDPQVVNNGVIHEWDHPTAEGLRQAGPPGAGSATQPEFVPQIGLAGEHTDDVLRELGHDDAGIAALRQEGIVG